LDLDLPPQPVGPQVHPLMGRGTDKNAWLTISVASDRLKVYPAKFLVSGEEIRP
jgi:hypothetical protein